MECITCGRNHNAQRLQFLCPTDARNNIYPSRLQNIQLLLENEALQQEIATLLSPGTTGVKASPSKDVIDDLKARQRLTEDKTSQILAAADKLQEDIRAARDEIQARKTALAKRKADMTAISEGLDQHRGRRALDVESSVSRYSEAWADNAMEMALTRRFLCHEAGQLYGLKKVTQVDGDKDEYHLGQLPVVDLMELNCEYYYPFLSFLLNSFIIHKWDILHQYFLVCSTAINNHYHYPSIIIIIVTLPSLSLS